MAPLDGCVFATLLMSDGYLPGAMVLGHSLRDKRAKGKLVAFVLLDKLAGETVRELKIVYDDVVPVQQVVNMQPANLYLMNRPDLISTFTKIELWRQTQYRRIVYLDADMVAIRAPNELLTLDTHFAAAPDVGWPDCFNSGMMVLNPNMADFYALQALARRGISFDGADQGLLNMHFTDWERVSFAYNCTPSANYQYVPAYRHFQSTISMIHFIGNEKPWTMGRDTKHNHGVFGELLGRWWTVYDRHYRQPKQQIFTGKKVQDYVRGEETVYTTVPSQPPPSPVPSAPPVQAQATPGIHVSAPPEDSAAAMERPFGDQPELDEKIGQEGYEPTSTIERRRWSAPHAEWEPTRQPPPSNSRPEAVNFPTEVYEMSQSRELFEPPASYPSPPKDMWYQVPEKPVEPTKPKHIFPWEATARKATRVFPRSRDPSPPPPPAPTGATTASTIQPVGQLDPAAVSSKLDQVAELVPKPPSPPRHVFPWEKRAPKATRVFPSEQPPPPRTTREEPRHVQTPSIGTDVTDETLETVPTPAAEATWDSFQQRTNAWDDMPEIARYMEAVSRPRRAKIQVLHHTPSTVNDDGDLKSPPIDRDRRPSLKLTDFPTEIERPSLPVTPAPIRRPTFWASEKDVQGDLPGAEGVPKQNEWNPIAKLEELSRKQSEIMQADKPLEGAKTPPRRDMPDSDSKDAVIEATEKSMAPKLPVPAKPILKQPSFELEPDLEETEASNPDETTNPTSLIATKSPPRFNPIVLEGEAASLSKNAEELLSPTSVA